MPTISFLPWTTASERIHVGAFHVLPCGEALKSGDVPPDLQEGVAAVLAAYGRSRPVDRRGVPLLRRGDAGVLDDLSDEQMEGYFEFRYRLAFSMLAARKFFQHRYANSDNLRLVVQRFTPEHAGGAVITSRRRDGAVNNIIPKGSLRVRRPEHVSGWCDIPRDLDVPLLHALERAATTPTALWPRLADAIRLFVGANTDSPDVSTHSELVDLVSAFSRLADAWDEDRTVGAFRQSMPTPIPVDVNASDRDVLPAPGFGPKLADPRMVKALAKGRTVREAWLRDAYVLRSQLGHGHIARSPYPSLWTLHEHLLLGAVILPLYVKRLLAAEGLYEWTSKDSELDEVFDTLATIEPFAIDDDGTDDENDDDPDGHQRTHPWRDVFNRAGMRRLAHLLYAEFDKIADAQDQTASATGEDTPTPTSQEDGGSDSSPATNEGRSASS